MGDPPPGAAAGRTATSVILLVVGLIVLAAGTLCLFAKRNVLDSHRLADTAVATLDHAEVRAFIVDETVSQAAARVPQAHAKRAEIERATSEVVSGDPFKPILRQAIVVTEGHLLNDHRDNYVLKLESMGRLVRKQLAKTDPTIAAAVPADVNLELGHIPVLPAVLQAAQKVEVLGLILPLVAIGLLIASVAVALDRTAATMRLGIGLLAWVLGGFLLMFFVGQLAVGVVPAGTRRDAAGPAWDEVVGPLRWWLGAVGAIGLLLAGFAYWRRRIEGAPVPA
jgi:hypothetical protein